MSPQQIANIRRNAKRAIRRAGLRVSSDIANVDLVNVRRLASLARCHHTNWRPVADGRKCMDCGEVLL